MSSFILIFLNSIFDFGGNCIKFSKSADDVDSLYVSPANGRLYLYDLDNTPGWDRITVTAIDYDNNESSTEFMVFIGPADGTPIVAAIPDTTIRAGSNSDWIDLDDYYFDVDNTDNEMIWTWAHSGVTAWLTLISIRCSIWLLWKRYIPIQPGAIKYYSPYSFFSTRNTL